MRVIAFAVNGTVLRLRHQLAMQAMRSGKTVATGEIGFGHSGNWESWSPSNWIPSCKGRRVQFDNYQITKIVSPLQGNPQTSRGSRTPARDAAWPWSAWVRGAAKSRSPGSRLWGYA